MQIQLSVHGRHCICHACRNERAANAERERRSTAGAADKPAGRAAVAAERRLDRWTKGVAA